MVGRNYLLYPSDIDLLAEILDDRNRLTTGALWRKQFGVSCAQQFAIETEVATRREAKLQAVADAAGVSLQDAFDHCMKVMRDPLEWTEADIAAAAQRISAEPKANTMEVLR